MLELLRFFFIAKIACQVQTQTESSPLCAFLLITETKQVIKRTSIEFTEFNHMTS